MFGTIAYMPLFVQGVIGTSATSSGVVLTPLVLGAVTTSIVSGQWVSRTGRYRLNALVGPIILARSQRISAKASGRSAKRESFGRFRPGLGFGYPDRFVRVHKVDRFYCTPGKERQGHSSLCPLRL